MCYSSTSFLGLRKLKDFGVLPLFLFYFQLFALQRTTSESVYSDPMLGQYH